MSSIKPISPVLAHVGANINFVYDEATPNSKWESSDQSILTIDSSGSATALRAGSTTVTYKGDVVLSSTVFISKISIIELESKPTYFTNVKSNTHYRDEY